MTQISQKSFSSSGLIFQYPILPPILPLKIAILRARWTPQFHVSWSWETQWNAWITKHYRHWMGFWVIDWYIFIMTSVWKESVCSPGLVSLVCFQGPWLSFACPALYQSQDHDDHDDHGDHEGHTHTDTVTVTTTVAPWVAFRRTRTGMTNCTSWGLKAVHRRFFKDEGKPGKPLGVGHSPKWCANSARDVCLRIP